MEGTGELLYLGKKCGLHGSYTASTGAISEDLNVSQQTVSRWLRELESRKLIVRETSAEGTRISLTVAGRRILEERYAELRNIFSGSMKALHGNVVSGLLEGKYYISIEGYSRQFEDKLGFKPYPGTLNLRAESTAIKEFISGTDKIKIDGFATKERTYGGASCYRAKLGGTVECAIIIPDRTLHAENIIEVIAPVNLRQRLKLKDGDKVALAR